MKKMEVRTTSQTFEFVVWKRRELMEKIDSLKRNLSVEDKQKLIGEITTGNQLVPFTEMDEIIKIVFELM